MKQSFPQRILLAVEAADLSESSLDVVRALAKSNNTVVDLLHVWEPVPFTPPDAVYSRGEATHSYREMAQEQGEAELGVVAERANQAGVRLGAQDVREGSPVQSIVDAAEEHSSDLIVVTHHQRSWARRWLQGSVSEKVARMAPCPVLVVPLNK